MADYGIGSWPARRARISPARTALRQAGRSLTYAGLAGRVDRLAGALARRGVRPGDRVAYLGLNDIATFEVFFAAGRLGALFVPMNTRLTAPEIGFLIDDARPAVLFHGPEHAAIVAETDPGRRGVGLVVPVAGTGYAELAGETSPAAGPFDGPGVGLDDPAVILYTSGTTGRPKGAVLSHGNLTFNTMNQLAHADVLSTDTALCVSPLFHATGLSQVSLPTMFKGGTVAVVPQFDPATVLDLIGRLGAASFSAVPTMLQLLCDHPGFEAADLSSLRCVIYGGSMVARRVAVAWQDRGVPLLQGYGMTEASPGVYMAPADGAGQRPVSIGVPHFFTDVALIPPGSAAAPGSRAGPVAQTEPRPGAAGELLVRGPHVFSGYWERPEATEQAFTDGWFRSGDVLRTDDDGWAYVVDRIKDMIISGGENVYPAEVEAVIDALPGVSASSVIAVPDERWGEVGMAFVVAEPGAWTAESLRAALAASLAGFKIPRYVRFVDDLPRTATGKVRKQDLRAAAAAQPEAARGDGAPAPPSRP